MLESLLKPRGANPLGWRVHRLFRSLRSVVPTPDTLKNVSSMLRVASRFSIE